MRRHPRRAEVDPTNPRGWAASDRNGMQGNLCRMRFQYEWRGPKLQNTKVLVHEDELDEPQRQLGTPALLGPDPLPLMNARPEQYFIDEQPVSTRYTMDGRIRVIMQNPHGYNINLITTVQGGILDGTVRRL
jgi:hypothetical protein